MPFLLLHLPVTYSVSIMCYRICSIKWVVFSVYTQLRRMCSFHINMPELYVWFLSIIIGVISFTFWWIICILYTMSHILPELWLRVLLFLLHPRVIPGP